MQTDVRSAVHLRRSNENRIFALVNANRNISLHIPITSLSGVSAFLIYHFSSTCRRMLVITSTIRQDQMMLCLFQEYLSFSGWEPEWVPPSCRWLRRPDQKASAYLLVGMVQQGQVCYQQILDVKLVAHSAKLLQAEGLRGKDFSIIWCIQVRNCQQCSGACTNCRLQLFRLNNLTSELRPKEVWILAWRQTVHQQEE